MQKAENDPIARRELAKNVYEQELWPSKLLGFGRVIWNEVSVRDVLDACFDLLMNDRDVDRHAKNIPGWNYALPLISSPWDENFDSARWWYKHAVRALENSLGLALKIMWAGSCDKRYGIKVSKGVYRALKTSWINHPERIVKSISKQKPYALCRFVERDADWEWLVPPLFKAIEISPDLLLPMLAVLLTCPADREGQNFSFFEKVAQKWFGSRVDELAEWFVKTEADWPEGDVAARFKTVKDWATNRLAKKPSTD